MIRSLLKRTKFHRAALPLLAMLLTATTAWADVEPVKYIDADGSEKNCEDYTVLTGGETSLAAGWYVVNSDISYTGTINLTGDVHLILKDGCTMNVGTSDAKIGGKGISATSGTNALTIYGQSGQTGKLNIYSTSNVLEDWGSIAIFGSVTVNGGNVTVRHYGVYGNGIFTNNSVIVNGGNVDVVSDQKSAASIREAITINGGNVTANGNNYGFLSGTITLGWNKTSDRICVTANSYSGTVKVADGKAFTDGTIGYSGTIAAPSDINGKTLVPAFSVNFAGGIEHGTVTANKPFVAVDAEDKDKTVTLTVTPDADYSIGTVSYNDGTEDYVITPTNNVYSFTMPASDVTVSAVFRPLSGYCGWSSENDGKNVTWAVTDTDGNGTYETLTIMGNGKIDNYDADGQPWFPYKSEITTAVIEEGVTVIGYRLLYQYPALTSVSIASSVMTIGDDAFYECSSLTTVNGASGVTYVYGNAFEGTAWRENLPDGLTYVGHVAYRFKGNETSITLDDNTTQIAESAFFKSKITSIDIPASVTYIGDYAFRESAVTTVVILGSLISIGDRAFSYSGLKKVYCLSSTPPQSVGSHAFENCNPTVVVPADAYNYYISAITSLNNNYFKKGYTITCGTDVTATSSGNGPLVVKGETVTLSYSGTIPEGYIVDYIVKDASDNDVTVTNGSFTMPESNVTVSAKWNTTINVEVGNANYMVAGHDAYVVVTMTPDDFNGIATISVTQNGGSPKPYNVAVVNGEGRYVVQNMASNSYTVQASFAGDDKYAESTSEDISLYVPMITTSLDISLDKTSINVGEKATVSITLNQTGFTKADGGTTPLETPKVLSNNEVVTIKLVPYNEDFTGDGFSTIGLNNGKGSFSLSGLAVGEYKFIVIFAGNDEIKGSSSEILKLTVNKNPTNVGVEVEAPVIAKEKNNNLK